MNISATAYLVGLPLILRFKSHLSCTLMHWFYEIKGIDGLVVMKPIFGIKVPGTKIKIRRESKVYFCVLVFILYIIRLNIVGFGFSCET